MSRVIAVESLGHERNRLSRQVVLAVRELMKQTEPDLRSKDLTSFIARALIDIHDTIDPSVTAWERKGYWVKADRFRLEWEWSYAYGEKLRKALLEEDWATIAATGVQIAQKLKNVRVPVRNRLGTPWEGAWAQLQVDQK